MREEEPPQTAASTAAGSSAMGSSMVPANDNVDDRSDDDQAVMETISCTQQRGTAKKNRDRKARGKAKAVAAKAPGGT